MTTTTSGLAPVATTTALDALVETLVRPTAQRRPQLARLVVGLDVLVAVIVAGAAAIYPSPGGTVRGAILLGWPVAIAVAGGYSRLTADPRRFPARALLAAALAAATAVWSLPALIPGAGTDESPRTLATVALFLAAMVFLASATARGVLALAAPASPAPTVLVGHWSQVRELLEEAARTGGRRAFDPVAVCLSDPASVDVDPVPEAVPMPVTVGGYDDLLEIVRTHHAEAVVVSPGPGITHADLRRWGARLQHEDVQLLVSSGAARRRPEPDRHGNPGRRPLLGIRPAALTGPSRLLKDVVDRVAGLLLLVLLAPLLGVLALLIRADSPGRALLPADPRRMARPAVHRLQAAHDVRGRRQHPPRPRGPERVGPERRAVQDQARSADHPAWAPSSASSLDELPQLINVVRGEMSLIGPRPALPGEVQAYAPDLRRRLDVKPGLTGLWQVSGRSDLSWDDTVRLDLQYVDNWSWWMDVRIALRTASAVLSRRGAY